MSIIQHRRTKEGVDRSVFPHQSDIVLIMGNGPTLTNYLAEIFEQVVLHKAVVIGVNHIYKLQWPGKVHYYIAADRHCWQMQGRDLRKMIAVRYFIPENYMQDTDLARVVPFRFCEESPFTFAKNWAEPIGHGYTTAFAAMQLAAMMRPERIKLYGVDFKICPQTGKSHFFGTAKRSKNFWEKGKKAIDIGVKEIEGLDINCEIRSPLFERVINA